MSNQVKMKNPAHVVTGKCRLSYANLWDPKSVNGGPAKYSVSVIIPKNDTKTLEAIQKAVDAAIAEGAGKFGGKVPVKSSLKLPLRNGDEDRPEDEAYAESYFLNANSNTAPGIVDKACNPILERSEVYSGIYARVSLSFYAYNQSGNRGIACGLQNIQKLSDGDPLGGKHRPEDDFETGSDEDFLA